MKQKLKLFSVIFWTALTVALGSIAVFLLALRFNLITSFNAYVVSSGSMEPAVKMGSVILTKRQPMYRVNDVIAFRRNDSSDTIVTHRVALAYRSEEFWKELTYLTRGDANKDFDQERVRDSGVVGKVLFSMPYLGYGVNAAKTPKGFIAFVIIPATIIVYEEIKALSAELKNALRKIKQKFHKQQILLHPLHLSESQKFRKAAVVIPFAGVALAVISITGSFFFDRETSANNLISVIAPTPTPGNDLLSIPTPTPTPPQESSPTPTPTNQPTATPTPQDIANHLVISEVQINGADAQQDFVELYNPTSSSVDLSGWKLRKRTPSGTESSLVEISNGKSIPAHGFFLWANNEDGYATSINADVSNTNNISENNSIALFSAADTGNTSPVDQVTWGNGTSQFVEGSPLANGPDSNRSIERKALTTSDSTAMNTGGSDEFKGNGFDSNNNATDYILRTTSQPQNSSSATESL